MVLQSAAVSAPARRGLALQGGPFSTSEATQFMRRPYAPDAVMVRICDALAKNPLARPPARSHFLPLLRHVSLSPLPVAA